MEFVSDPVMLQIMLTAFFDDKFENFDIMAFDQYRDVIESYIKEPFLRNPLWRKYNETRQKIYNIQPPPRTILHNMADDSHLSGNQMIDDLLQRNHGKLIYIVFWATWANQCLTDMPDIKRLQMEWMDKDVVFAHFCFESLERQWLTTVDKYELGGNHYLLSDRQSADLRKLFKINDMPFYMLIDKNGVIMEKGTHLKPFTVRNRINEHIF